MGEVETGSALANEFFIKEDILTFWTGKNAEVVQELAGCENFNRIKRYDISLSNLKIEEFKAKHITFGEIKDIFLKFSFGRIRIYGDKKPRIFQGICTSRSRTNRKELFFHFVYVSAYDKADNLVEALHFRNDSEVVYSLIDIMLNDEYFDISEDIKPKEINLDA